MFKMNLDASELHVEGVLECLCGSDEAALSKGELGTDAFVDRTFGPAFQSDSKTVGRSQPENWTDHARIADHRVHQSRVSIDLDSPGFDVFIGDKACHSCSVVGVIVSVDNRLHGLCCDLSKLSENCLGGIDRL